MQLQSRPTLAHAQMAELKHTTFGFTLSLGRQWGQKLPPPIGTFFGKCWKVQQVAWPKSPLQKAGTEQKWGDFPDVSWLQTTFDQKCSNYTFHTSEFLRSCAAAAWWLTPRQFQQALFFGRIVQHLNNTVMYPPELTARPWKWMVGRLVASWDGLFSVFMLVYGRVSAACI